MKQTLLNNRYKIIREIGSGGFGQTYLAEDTHLPSRRYCVIKQLKPVANLAQSQFVTERFEREAIILERLGAGSQQIPKLYAYFVEDDRFFLVQEWIEGKNLFQKVVEEGTMREPAVRDVLVSLLPVLDFIHSQRIIHRDIKPDNILYREQDNSLVLIDFGIVKEVASLDSTGNSAVSVVAGTPVYMPLEQAAGKPVFASDIYSLALTAIFLLTGKNPRELTDITSGELVWRQLAGPITAEFAQILDKATEQLVRDRYKTAVEMLAELKKLPQANKTSEVAATDLLGSGLRTSPGLGQTVGENYLVDQEAPTAVMPDAVKSPAAPVLAAPPTRAMATLPPTEAVAALPPTELVARRLTRPRQVKWLGVGFAALATTCLAVGLVVHSVIDNKRNKVKVQTPSNVAVTKPTPTRPVTEESALPYKARGNDLLAQGQPDRALDEFTRALEIDPADPESYHSRGQIYLAKNDLEQALADFDQALQLNPRFAEAYYHRGLVYSKSEDCDEAISNYTEAIELNPAHAEAYHGRGLCYQRMEQPTEALADYNHAIAINPTYTEALDHRSQLYISMGEYKLGANDAKQAVKPHPDVPLPPLPPDFKVPGVNFEEWPKDFSLAQQRIDQEIKQVKAEIEKYNSPQLQERLRALEIAKEQMKNTNLEKLQKWRTQQAERNARRRKQREHRQQ